jgi:hypothetical protein
VAGLLLHEALSIIESNVHGPAVGINGPSRDQHYFILILIGLLDRLAVDQLD